MQDIHAMGGGGRLFGGGGGDRRLRPHSHHQNHQALKCPRCDSLNTKFCYYNNYNLSQPRHFCKSCRRYWTKGGVLRNVPVGGGCRKAKRTKSKPSNPDSSAAAAATETVATTTTTSSQQHRDRKASSHSSSESSSLTAANSNAIVGTASTNAGTGAAATAEVSGQSSGSVSNLLNVNDTKLYGHANANCGFEPGKLLHEQGPDCGIFSEIGSFTSLITSSSNETMSFGFGNMLSQAQSLDQNPEQWQNQQQQKMVNMGGGGEELKMQEITGGGLLDQTVQLELSALHGRSGNGGFGSLDWQAGGDQGLFDLPNAVDQAYWSQGQWTDQDQPSLYLP